MIYRLLFVSLLLTACGDNPADNVELTTTQTDYTGPTWHQDIAPIIAQRCGSCHVEGGLAEFLRIDEYETAKVSSSVIADQVATKTMPPFGAESTEECTPRFGFMHDPTLPEEEVATLMDWIEAGSPEGDAATAAEIPAPPSYALDSWDLELTAQQSYTPPQGDIQMCFVLYPELTERKWMVGLEVVPQDRGVAHHIQVRLDDKLTEGVKAGPEGWYECGGLIDGVDLGGYLPGTAPVQLPEGVAIPINPGQPIIMQVHYHVADGELHPDQSTLRLQFGDEPEVAPIQIRIGNDRHPTPVGGNIPGEDDPETGSTFFIPAGKSMHEELFRLDVSENIRDYKVVFTANHMHYVGIEAMLWVDHANPLPGEPESECILQTPRWDIDWQQFYYYDFATGASPRVSGGDTLWLRCRFDNSEANEAWMEQLDLAGVTEFPDVMIGATSLDEMCAAVISLAEVQL